MTRILPVKDEIQHNVASKELLNGLNNTQRLAAETTEGPVLILAGAGSGKTRVLTFRLAYLLQQGVAPRNVIALTFTNKAAREMKERVEALTNPKLAKSLWMGTFHSLFARILRMEAEHIGFTSAYTIYDADDSLALIRSVMQAQGINQQNIKPQAVRSAISSAKNSMLSWQEFQRTADNTFQRQAGLIYEKYEHQLRTSNAMDFDDIILHLIKLWRNNPDILQRYQEQFKYILVDEYQDTNRAQYTAMQMLAAKYRNICAVGDDAQSIYGWRGADIRNILDFGKDYPEAKVVRLEQNYRSTQHILSVANAVIANNTRQLKKELWTSNPEGEKIRLIRCDSDREEAGTVVRVLQELQQQYNLSDCAVLYRTNAQSQAFEEAFLKNSIPYTIVGGISFYKRKEVKDVVAYLRLLVNPADTTSLLRVINLPARGIGNKTLEILTDTATANNCSIWDVLQHLEQYSIATARTKQSLENFTSLVQRFQHLLRGEESLADVVIAYIQATGIVAMYEEENDSESLDRWGNIQQVFSLVRAYQERVLEEGETPTLEAFLQEIALMTDADEEVAATEAITLMTLHSAKGLEFPVVFLAGMEQGLFPMGDIWKLTPEEIEEERRLCYVGITRAKERLYMLYADKRFRYGNLMYCQPSQFLDEIPADLIAKGLIGGQSSTPQQQAITAGGVRKLADLIGKKTPATPKPVNPFADELPNDEYSQIPPEKPKKQPSVTPEKPRPIGEAVLSKPMNINELKEKLASLTATPAQREKQPAPIPKPPSPALPKTTSNPKPKPEDEAQKKIATKSADFKAGLSVEHDSFGKGRVISVSGVGEMRKASIYFDKVGRKEIILQYGASKMKIIG